MAVFWDIAPVSLVDTDRRFREVYSLHHQGAVIEFTISYSSETCFDNLRDADKWTQKKERKLYN
jgi:hypothetical protein